MKALQINNPGDFEVKDAPMPKPGPGEILLKVLAVTTCPHWDMHILGGEPMFPGTELHYPYTLGQPGHEACGDIAAVGEGVTRLAMGDRVASWIDPGHDKPGCYAQYVVKPAEHVIHVPATLPPEACAPFELATCAAAFLVQVERIDTIQGKRVGVFGLGPAGLVFIQLALAAGAVEVVGFDPLPERRDLAARLGAAQVIDSASPEAEAFPRCFTPGCLDIAFDCVGHPAVARRAMEVTKHIVSLFAVQREPYVFEQHCWGRMTLTARGPQDFSTAEYVAKRLNEGKLDLGPLVTRKMPLQDYAEGVELLRKREATKIAFMPQES